MLRVAKLPLREVILEVEESAWWSRAMLLRQARIALQVIYRRRRGEERGIGVRMRHFDGGGQLMVVVQLLATDSTCRGLPPVVPRGALAVVGGARRHGMQMQMRQPPAYLLLH